MSLCIAGPFARLSPHVNKYPTNLPKCRSTSCDVLPERAGFLQGHLPGAGLILVKSNLAAIGVAGIFLPSQTAAV